MTSPAAAAAGAISAVARVTRGWRSRELQVVDPPPDSGVEWKATSNCAKRRGRPALGFPPSGEEVVGSVPGHPVFVVAGDVAFLARIQALVLGARERRAGRGKGDLFVPPEGFAPEYVRLIVVTAAHGDVDAGLRAFPLLSSPGQLSKAERFAKVDDVGRVSRERDQAAGIDLEFGNLPPQVSLVENPEEQAPGGNGRKLRSTTS